MINNISNLQLNKDEINTKNYVYFDKDFRPLCWKKLKSKPISLKNIRKHDVNSNQFKKGCEEIVDVAVFFYSLNFEEIADENLSLD